MLREASGTVVRPVVSFVRRSPRMNASQATAWERWHERYLVDGLPRLEAGLKRAPRHPRDEPGDHAGSRTQPCGFATPCGAPGGVVVGRRTSSPTPSSALPATPPAAAHLPQIGHDSPRGVRAVRLAPQPRLDLAGLFGRTAPVAVEIGVGAGESLAALAQLHPDWNVLGFEVYEKALASTMGRLAHHGVDNVRLICADGVGGLELLLGPGSVTELDTYFPDPWPKKRHHKRRLVTPEFARLVASRLVPGGRWRLATDWDDYAAAIAEVLAGCPGLVDEYAGSPAPRPEARPLTKFEQRGRSAGRAIHEFCWIRAGGGGA